MSDMHATPPQQPPRFGWKKTLVYSLVPALVLLVLVEGGARVFEIFVPPRAVDIGQGFTAESRLFVPDPENPAYLVTNPNKTVLVHDQPLFRPRRFSREKPEGVFRAFFLGGSSVNYLDYELPNMSMRLTTELPDCAGVEIINCGGLSYGSHRLVLIAAEILEYDPDLVMIYSGHNEFEELEQFRMARPSSVPLERVLNRIAVFRFIRDRFAALQVSRLQRERNARIATQSIPDAARAWGHSFSEAEIAGRMDTYRENLLSIVQLCRGRGVPVVLGTVPSNLFRPALPGEAGACYEAEVLPLFSAGKYEEGRARAQAILTRVARHQSSDAENAVVRELAAGHGVALADVEKAVAAREPNGVPGETLFNDHCHLNAEGNRILVFTYEDALLGLFR